MKKIENIAQATEQGYYHDYLSHRIVCIVISPEGRPAVIASILDSLSQESIDAWKDKIDSVYLPHHPWYRP